jgi:hypothetical protein
VVLADYLFHQNLIQNFAAGPAAPVGTEHSFRLAVPVPARAETGEVLNITYRTVAMRRWKATNAHPTISLGSMTFLPRCGIDGYVRALDGWTYFVDDSVRSMQLLNFPMQANGAAMMRRATIRCWEAGTLDLVCTHHDALYLNCREEERDQAIETLVRCMDHACHDILGDRVRIPVDINIYDANTGYSDGRGAETLKAIRDLLDECW